MPNVTAEEPYWIPRAATRGALNAPTALYGVSSVQVVWGVRNGCAKLTGVDGIDVSGLETVSPLFTYPLPPFEPLLHLKEKHKSKQREIKQRFMKRMKQGSKK